MNETMVCFKEPVTILLVGVSGSGKSFLSAHLCNMYKKPVILFNSSVSDYRGLLSKKISVQVGIWNQECVRNDTTYVIEDVHSLTPKQCKYVTRLLNYNSRHNRSPVLLVTHSINNNGIFGLLPFFTSIYITSSKANMRLVSKLTKALYFPDPVNVTSAFHSLKKHEYLAIDPQRHTFSIINVRDLGKKTSILTKPSKKVLCAEMLAEYLKEKAKSGIVTFLLKNISHRYIHERDLSLKGKSKKGRQINFSLLDYLHVLMDEKARASRELLMLHKFFLKQFTFPYCLIENKSLCF